MKTKMLLATLFLLGFATLLVSSPLSDRKDTPQDSSSAKSVNEKFAANAFMPSGAGRRMVGAGAMMPVDIYINQYSSDDEVKQLAGSLIEGGPEALQKQLEKLKPKGRINLTGRVGFYELKAIRSRQTPTGRRIIAITDRPIGFLEAYYANPSQDYKVGLLVLDLKTNQKGKEEGEGQMMYAAKLNIKDNVVEVETYGVAPISMRNVRKF